MEIRIVVHTEEGLHARPAAVFVQTAAAFQSSVQVRNLTNGRGPAPARSILAILTLGVRHGDEVLLRAEGEDAQRALEALVALLDGQPPS